MPTVEKTGGPRVYVRAVGREFVPGGRAEVSESEARYLLEERDDFEWVGEGADADGAAGAKDGNAGGDGNNVAATDELDESDAVDEEESADPDTDEEDAICGYYDAETMDQPCQRDPGWGRDADTGYCTDHHEEA